MKILPGIHILMEKTLAEKIENAKTEQRKMTSAIMARLLRDNEMLKQKFNNLPKKLKR